MWFKGCVALPDTNSEKKIYTNSAKIFLLKIALIHQENQ